MKVSSIANAIYDELLVVPPSGSSRCSPNVHDRALRYSRILSFLTLDCTSTAIRFKSESLSHKSRVDELSTTFLKSLHNRSGQAASVIEPPRWDLRYSGLKVESRMVAGQNIAKILTVD